MGTGKNKGIGFALFAAVLSVCPVSGSAYRPFATEDAGVAGGAVAQLELSLDRLSWNDGRENIGLLVPVYGVSRRLEISAEIPYLLHDHEGQESRRGIGDVNLVGKYLLLEEREARPALVLKNAVKTKSGDEADGLGSGDADFNITAAASKTLGALTLHGMLGYTFVGANGDDGIRDITIYGLAADYGLTRRLHLAAEIAGSKHPERAMREDPLSGLLGFIFKFSEELALDAGARYGFNKAMPKWSTTVGASVTF